MRTRSSFLAAIALALAACSQAPELAPLPTEYTAPIERIDTHLVGFHPMKDDPHHAVEAHHYCSRLSEDFTQCVLFDGVGKDAKLTGVEYIISERVFEALPEEERQYWHPHNFEIMSGMLAMPGVSEHDEYDAMRSLVNSYGKTWHLWQTGGTGEGAPLPFGEPSLAWSFNAYGEAPRELVQARDRKFSISSEKKARVREDFAPFLHCQEGVDALADAFPNRQPMPGVCEKAD